MRRFRRTLLFRYAVAFGLIFLAIALVILFVVHAGAGQAAGILIGVAVLLGALGALTIWTERTLTADLRELGRAMEKVVIEGDLANMPQPRLAELTDLAQDLNTIATRVKDDYQMLTRERDWLEAILANTNAGIIVVNHELRIDHINPAAEKILGTTREFAQGRTFTEIHHTPAIDQAIERSRSGSPVSQEVTINLPRRRDLGVQASPIRNEEGRVTGVVCILEDVTARLRLERTRRDFVANVSHELRTPVANLCAVVEALLAGAISDRAASERFLADLDRESRRLSDIIDDLLVVSRLETEGMTHLEEEFDVGSVLAEVMEDKADLARRHQVALTLSGDTAGATLKGDRKLFKTAFANLVDNAIKYNRPGGSVNVEVERSGDSLAVRVEDTGIGIPRRDVRRVFERFYRVDRARSRETGGTGLGLSIVKHVAEFHGGTVEVESVEGQGSAFKLSIPHSRSLS
jgi:two-component system phosphate regulon sensor histidine kinase PhoR